MEQGKTHRITAWLSTWRGWVLLLGGLLAGFGAILLYNGEEWRGAIEAREAIGKSARGLDFAMVYGWWGALINCGILLVLLATLPFWSKPTKGTGIVSQEKSTKGFWIMVGLAALVGLSLRAPRMDLSLYNDEAYTLRRQVSGEFKQKGEEFKFRQVKWSETLWENDLGNNPVLFSILARISYDNWKQRSGSTAGEVNEFWFRFPALVAGLLGIVTAAWFALALSGSRKIAGLIAFLIAFHPWHVRYSTEARGYGLVLMLVPLMLVGLTYAIRTGKWRWWLLFAAAQFLAAASFVGVLYFCLVLNGALALWLGWKSWKQRKATTEDAEQSSQRLLGRLLVANTLSGILFIGLMFPHLPQIAEALANADSHKSSGHSWRWWPDILSYLGLGMPTFDGASASKISPSLMGAYEGQEGRSILGSVLAVVILLGLGAYNAWRRDGMSRCLVIAVALTPVLYFIATVTRDNALYRWHMIFLVPAVITLIGYGVSSGGKDRKTKIDAQAVVRIVLVLMLFGGFAFPLESYVRHSKENPRAMVVRARGDVFPHYQELEKQVHFAAFNCVGVYDPHVAITPLPNQIKEQMALADQSGKELYVQFARKPLVAKATLALLEDESLFELVAMESGLEENQYNNYLYRYKATAVPETEDEESESE